MRDLSNAPSLSQSFKEIAFQQGWLIEKRFDEMDVDRQQKLDSAINILMGKDANMMTILESFQRIADADEGTAEYEEGVNLYSLMQSNYIALDDRLTANVTMTTALNVWKTQFVTDHDAAINNINLAISAETDARTLEVNRLDARINSSNASITAANDARTALALRLDQTDASQTVEIDGLKVRMASAEQSVLTNTQDVSALKLQMAERVEEITSLQTKQAELNTRVGLIEDMLDINVAEVVGNFGDGLNGLASRSDFQPPAEYNI